MSYREELSKAIEEMRVREGYSEETFVSPGYGFHDDLLDVIEKHWSDAAIFWRNRVEHSTNLIAKLYAAMNDDDETVKENARRAHMGWVAKYK